MAQEGSLKSDCVYPTVSVSQNLVFLNLKELNLGVF